MKNDITIKIVKNGVIAKFTDYEGSEEIAYEFDEKNPNRLVDLLQDINEIIGHPNDNYAERQKQVIIRLVEVHGRKFECNITAGCKLCEMMKVLNRIYEIGEENETHMPQLS
jgi:hypothetical protein